MAQDHAGLTRFVEAQEPVWEQVRSELERGRKSSHWMWFVFPQVAGLGSSPTAQHFGLAGVDQAQAYAAHPVLGERLRQGARLLLGLDSTDPVAVLGSIDALKLCSSMTLFEVAVPGEPLFAAVLERFYAGRRDERTLALLGRTD